jgi:hypothetical protein
MLVGVVVGLGRGREILRRWGLFRFVGYMGWLVRLESRRYGDLTKLPGM